MNTAAINYAKGRYNPAGTTLIYYLLPEDVDTFPVPADPATATTFDSLVELATAIVMKEGKQMFPIYCTLEEGELKSTLQGPRDGKGYENMMSLSFPGNDSIFLGWQSYFANRDVIFVVKEKNGKVRVLGSLEDPAYMDTAEGTSGKKVADGRATVLTFKATGSTPPPVYTQALTSLLTPEPGA